MLRKLGLHGVGPASSLVMDPVAERLNLITGDNGLGKSFLLEAAWWALTRTWHETKAIPNRPDARIEHHFDIRDGLFVAPSTWNPQAQRWKREQTGRVNPGLVLYARVDGSISVWDPFRSQRFYTRDDGGISTSPVSYQFDSRSVLWGLGRTVPQGDVTRTQLLCKGLVDDWCYWQRVGDKRFDLLKGLLADLGPDGEPLVPGQPIRPSLDDVREIPTIRMPYGQDVPITYAPAGVRRMCGLAYLLTWALSEHQEEAERLQEEPSNQVIVLVDELETHLHPRWQRTVLPSLMTALTETPDAPRFQFLVATHSPLVLASVEAQFDPAKDALWKLDLVDGDVQIERDVWHKRGDAKMWLVSDVFDETSTYSVEAEAVMERAAELMGADSATQAEADAVGTELERVLADTDPFWLGWGFWRTSKGWDT